MLDSVGALTFCSTVFILIVRTAAGRKRAGDTLEPEIEGVLVVDALFFFAVVPTSSASPECIFAYPPDYLVCACKGDALFVLTPLLSTEVRNKRAGVGFVPEEERVGGGGGNELHISINKYSNRARVYVYMVCMCEYGCSSDVCISYTN